MYEEFSRQSSRYGVSRCSGFGTYLPVEAVMCKAGDSGSGRDQSGYVFFGSNPWNSGLFAGFCPGAYLFVLTGFVKTIQRKYRKSVKRYQKNTGVKLEKMVVIVTKGKGQNLSKAPKVKKMGKFR